MPASAYYIPAERLKLESSNSALTTRPEGSLYYRNDTDKVAVIVASSTENQLGTGGGGSVTGVVFYRTVLTGGGADSIDGIVTAGGAVLPGQQVQFSDPAAPTATRTFMFIVDPDPGVTVDDAVGGIILPDDHDPGTNAFIWQEI